MKADGAAQSYSSLAETYNNIRFSGMAGRFLYETDRRIITGMFDKTSAKKLLDVPVGTGRVLDYLRDSGCEVIGVDATSEMLDVAKTVAGPPQKTLQIGNAANLDFEDHTFDCLTSLRFFHLFPPSQRVPFAEEFTRVVKPQGYAIISFTNGWYCGGLNWFRKFLGKKTVHFIYPGEIQRLFPEWNVLQLEGNFLPKQYWFDRLPVIGKVIQFITGHFPGNLICWERFYLLQKKD